MKQSIPLFVGAGLLIFAAAWTVGTRSRGPAPTAAAPVASYPLSAQAQQRLDAQHFPAALAAAQQAPQSALPHRPALTVEPERLLRDLEALSTPRAHQSERLHARRILAHRLLEMNYRPALNGFAEGVNVLSERPGSDPDAGVILVAAHYDTVEGSPGADDNTTGIAALLEVARLLRDVETPATLQLAFFDAEERGLLGSQVFAADETRHAQLRAVIVLDMLGATCGEPGCQALPEGVVPMLERALPGQLPAADAWGGDFLAVIGTPQDAPLMRAFRQASGPGQPGAAPPLGTPPPTEPGAAPTPPPKPPVLALPVPHRGLDLPDTRRSDHAPFWDQDLRAVFVTDTADLRNPHYHKPSDRLETLDLAFLAGNTQILVEAVYALLMAPPPPARPSAPAPP